FDLNLASLGFTARHLAPEAALSGIGNVLRNAKTNVSKIAIRVTGERTRASNRELLNADLSIRQRRDLFCDMPRCFVTLLCRGDLRIVLLGFANEFLKRDDRPGRWHSWNFLPSRGLLL